MLLLIAIGGEGGVVPTVGGPDGYFYFYISTQDGDPVSFNYIDITSTGIAVGATDDWCSGYNASTLYP
ncbi:MAG: hypothetical protein GXO39_02050, partial [Thermotogae bacterium]|nr:hypothetical protein [Thermotogota bacterium]